MCPLAATRRICLFQMREVQLRIPQMKDAYSLQCMRKDWMGNG